MQGSSINISPEAVLVGAVLGAAYLAALLRWKSYIALKPEERTIKAGRTIGSTAAVVALGPVVLLGSLALELFPAHNEIVLFCMIFAMLLAVYLMATYIRDNRIFKDDSVSAHVRRRITVEKSNRKQKKRHTR